jgi:hypothetical protein
MNTQKLVAAMAVMILLVLALVSAQVEFKNVPCSDFENMPPTHATMDFGGRQIYYVGNTYALALNHLDVGSTYMVMGAFKDKTTGQMMLGSSDPFVAEEPTQVIDVTFLPEDAGPGGFGLQETDGRDIRYSTITFHVENNWFAATWEKIMNWFKGNK